MPCPNPSRLRNLTRRRPLLHRTARLDPAARLRRIRYRAWHRGTRETDFLVGGFFDTCSPGWSETDIVWFEALLEEQDADIIAWVIGTLPVPQRFAGPMMTRMQHTDYLNVAEDGA